jgi:hypothetical protein
VNRLITPEELFQKWHLHLFETVHLFETEIEQQIVRLLLKD